MSLTKTEQKFIAENKGLIEAILAKKEELKQRIDALANDVKIRQYKDRDRQEAYLMSLQNKKLARARMISRIVKKLDTQDAYAALGLDPGSVAEQIKESIEDAEDDSFEDPDSDEIETVRLDKKSVKKLAKETAKQSKKKGGASIIYG